MQLKFRPGKWIGTLGIRRGEGQGAAQRLASRRQQRFSPSTRLSIGANDPGFRGQLWSEKGFNRTIYESRKNLFKFLFVKLIHKIGITNVQL